MTTGYPPLDLARLAAAITVPVDAFGPARAYVQAVREGSDHAPNAPCDHRFGYRTYFGLDGGRRREPVGPVFERPREAGRLAAVLNGDPVASDPPVGGPPRPTVGTETIVATSALVPPSPPGAGSSVDGPGQLAFGLLAPIEVEALPPTT